MKTRLIYILIVLSTILNAKNHVPNQILVQRKPDVSHIEFVNTIDLQNYKVDKLLVKRLGIYRLKIVNSTLSDYDALAEFRSNPWVKNAQLDHYTSQRQTFPDDSQFGQMWALHNNGSNGAVEDADIDAPEAWDIATGGLTALGDTIVVAVVDGGCDLNHPDLVDNIWTNRHEIPANGIDDDNNGYIDDYNGWDAYSSDGSISSDQHGTHVSGTVGAKGNNGSQVVGVSWNVKIMTVMASTSQTSIAVEGYGYVLDQRMRYNETNGDSGAFVVSTNSSFGVNFGDCSSGSYPLWNEMYNAMGEAGILSAAATMNINANVDTQGDVPTGCDSDWLIAVTNTTSSDVKNSGAAYGPTMVDLGAPGTSVLSTLPNNNTGTLTGTSMATPHVAGAVGLMHNAMSNGFAQFYKDNPGEGALALKQLILDGTDPLTSLNGITVSGGRLNIYNSALLVQGFMASDSLDPNPITNLEADTNQVFYITLNWDDPTLLFGGDPITDFVVEVSKDGNYMTSIAPGVETYTNGPLQGATNYTFSLMTRLTSNDSTSVPISITVRASGGDHVPGDATHDGRVDVTDIIRVLRFILEYDEPNELDMYTADVVSDGVLNIFDVLAIVDIILGN
ncbi:MAG: S8 family serine peptidase [Candidatus Marinimicrobia bacterium]|nr:S8 family serine peptidase [Candidatus Neomarinimicrobiota bacterium]